MAANKMRIPLAKMAVEETGMGVVEDKVIKTTMLLSISIMRTKTLKPAVLLKRTLLSVLKNSRAFGVIAAVIPTTNPTSTAIFKTLIALKTRNAIIISPHPGQKTQR